MTFKHTKNWDSEVMRSLEKVAYQKGLIKPEPLPQKTASVIKKADVTPTSDVMANIFKLCVALRAEGLVKEASDVENSYLNYKRAQTLYEAFKEKGEDVIHDAHSEGSHKMENIDSDEAVFEDILDKHEKIMKAVEKKPTGKLSSAKDILEAVKVTLGASPLALRKDNTSDPRSYLSSKKSLGQESPPKSDSSGVATGVGGTIGAMSVLWAVTKIFNSVGKILGNAKAAWKIVGLAEDFELRNLTNAQLSQLAMKLATNAGSKTMQAVAQDVGPSVLKAAAPEMEQIALNLGTKAIPAATESASGSGIASWIANIGESVWAAGGTSVGEAGAGAVGGAVVSAGAIGATIGYLLGKYVFFGEMPETIKNISEAGDKILSDLEFMSGSLDNNDKEYAKQFTDVLAKIKELMPNQEKLISNPSQEEVISLLSFSDVLGESTTIARNIWGSATSHIDDQLFGTMRGFSNVKKHAQDFIDAANKIRGAIIKGSQQFRAEIQKQLDARSAASGGADKLIQGYRGALADVSKYQAIIKAKRMPNAEQLNSWLDSMKAYIKSEGDEFYSIKEPANQAAVAKEYFARLKDVTDRLNAFQKVVADKPNTSPQMVS